MMISNKDALRFVEEGIPNMIGTMDPEMVEYYERFENRIRYLTTINGGVLPKFHKGKSINDYWTCGNCGHGIHDVCAKYCSNCGVFLTTKFPNYKNRKEGD